MRTMRNRLPTIVGRWGSFRLTKVRLTVLVIASWLMVQIVQFQMQPDPDEDFSVAIKRRSVLNNLELLDGSNRTFQGVDWWEQRQYARRQLVEDVCASRQVHVNDELQVAHQLLVDDLHKVLYCVVPKAACTSWKEALVFLTGKLNHTDPQKIRHAVHDDKFLASKGLRYLDHYKIDSNMGQRLKDYVKIITVRHPLERLLSAYRDKFAPTNIWTRFFHQKFGRRIVHAYRKHPSRDSLMTGSDVTFKEFLTFVADTRWSYDFRVNQHWMRYQDLCKPCQLRYDYIINLETLNEDSSEILERVFNSSLKLFPKVNSKKVDSHSLLRNEYSDIPPRIIQRLLRIYQDDFEMFGYEWP